MIDIIAGVAKLDLANIVALTLLLVVAAAAHASIKWAGWRRADRRAQEDQAAADQRAVADRAAREAARLERGDVLMRRIADAISTDRAAMMTEYRQERAAMMSEYKRDREDLARSLVEAIDLKGCGSPCELTGELRGRLHKMHEVATAQRPDGTYRAHGNAHAEAAAVESIDVLKDLRRNGVA